MYRYTDGFVYLTASFQDIYCSNLFHQSSVSESFVFWVEKVKFYSVWDVTFSILAFISQDVAILTCITWHVWTHFRYMIPQIRNNRTNSWLHVIVSIFGHWPGIFCWFLKENNVFFNLLIIISVILYFPLGSITSN